MTIEELNSLVEAGTETQTLDFKDDCAWHAVSFAKDIMAMSNVQDGGQIVIGVHENEDGSYSKVGVSPENKATFVRDTMLDQLARFADPHVSFSMDFVTTEGGMDFIVISVEPFQEVPVICRADADGLQAGAMYYRNRNSRPQSARVSNSFDMRDVVERAAIKLMQRARALGYSVPDQSSEARRSLAEERGDL